MLEIRFHGRGGQGAVIASLILACAAFKEGKEVQTFPFFGVERRGAPVTAFTRISAEKIRAKHQIYNPDYIIVLDPTLFDAANVVHGLKKNGSILVNADKSRLLWLKKRIGSGFKIATVDASAIATDLGLGGKTSPIVNTAIMGGVAKFTSIVRLGSVISCIRERVPFKVEENVKAAEEAYKKVSV